MAVLSVLYLALGDPFASTLGIKFGKLGPRFPNGKSLVGSLCGFVICMATTALYFARSLQQCGSLALVSLLGGVAGSLAYLFLASTPASPVLLPVCRFGFRQYAGLTQRCLRCIATK